MDWRSCRSARSAAILASVASAMSVANVGSGARALMKRFMETIRGSVAFAFIVLNTVFWCLPVYLLGALKPLLPAPWQVPLATVMFRAVDGWVACVRWLASALGMVRLRTTMAGDGMPALHLEGSYLVVCNHQSWADILVLTFAFLGRIPQFKFFTKRQLVWVPFIGVALWLLDFPLVRRYGRQRLQANPELRERDQQAIRHACESFRERPTSVLSFAEGTRFSVAKRDAQGSPYKRLLNPKIGGVAMVLEQVGERLDAVVDVTIVYGGDGGASAMQAPSFWAFLCGRSPTVRVEARTLTLPSGDGDALKTWLARLWEEKDAAVQQIEGSFAQRAGASNAPR